MFRHTEMEDPIIKTGSSNLETLLALCVMNVGACFCPENLAKSILPGEQFDSLKIFRLGDIAKYQLRFGYLAQSYQWSIIETFIQQAENYYKGL